MEIRKQYGLQYNFAVPADFDPAKRYPLLIYLHGAGGRGHDPAGARYPYMLEEHFRKTNVQMLIAGPLCEFENWFCCFSELIAWVREIVKEPCVDPDRVCLMGSSMGGYACWTLLECIPEVFACGVPVCGGGMAWDAGRIRDIPIRAFHGELDGAVLVSENQRMVDFVNGSGGQAELTVFPGVGHNAWSPALYETDLVDWILRQRRRPAAEGQ